jgi:hypothetical protein
MNVINPIHQSKRILSQQDAIDFCNGHKQWIDFVIDHSEENKIEINLLHNKIEQLEIKNLEQIKEIKELKIAGKKLGDFNNELLMKVLGDNKIPNFIHLKENNK